MTRTRWFRLSLVVVAVLGGVAMARKYWRPAEVHVSTATVTDGPMTRRIVATGSLQPVTTVEVGSQESGMVQSLLVDYNSFVHAGDVVARLDPALYDAQYQSAQATLGEAEAAAAQARATVAGSRTAVEDAQTKLARAQSLAARELIPQADLDAARIAADAAAADLSSSLAMVTQSDAAVTQGKAALQQAAVNVDHTIIRAPIDGIVVDRDVDVGQTLAASVQSPVLFRIAADLTRMQVQVNVDESDVGGLAQGESAAFSVETFPGETFHGTVSQVRLQPVTEQATTATTVAATVQAAQTSSVPTVVSYTAIVDVSNPDQRLRPGMTAEVVLSGAQRDHVVRIPNPALSFRPPAEVLQAVGERDPVIPNAKDQGLREVWEYDGRQFTPIAVHAGLADDGWTELVSGQSGPATRSSRARPYPIGIEPPPSA
ncbi:MAG: efflux RND transporter periplasmic adaptor subunit [Vicinamibacterales bacterium]